MKSKREKAAEYRLAHWAQVMQERNESGMSIKVYCESVGLKINVYYYWQRKLRMTAMESMQHDSEVMRINQPASPIHKTPKGWAVCETGVSVQRTTGNNEIQVEIGRSRVTVRKDTDPELLAQVCRILVTVC